MKQIILRIAFLTLLIVSFGQMFGQFTKFDPSKAITMYNDDDSFTNEVQYTSQLDTVKVLILYTDLSDMYVKSTYALSVRELHNNVDGKLDPYFEYGFKRKEWWEHSYYMTLTKDPLPDNWVVWQRN